MPAVTARGGPKMLWFQTTFSAATGWLDADRASSETAIAPAATAGAQDLRIAVLPWKARLCELFAQSMHNIAREDKAFRVRNMDRGTRLKFRGAAICVSRERHCY